MPMQHMRTILHQNGQSDLGFSAKSPRRGKFSDGLVQVRDPTTWTALQHDGPNHLGLRLNALPGHQMALITSDYVPVRA